MASLPCQAILCFDPSWRQRYQKPPPKRLIYFRPGVRVVWSRPDLPPVDSAGRKFREAFPAERRVAPQELLESFLETSVDRQKFSRVPRPLWAVAGWRLRRGARRIESAQCRRHTPLDVWTGSWESRAATFPGQSWRVCGPQGAESAGNMWDCERSTAS